MNEELLKEVKGLIPYIAIALIVVGGYYGVKHHIEAKKVAASSEVVNALTVEELEGAVTEYGSTATGPVLKMRLAKQYFDAGRYEEALAQYEDLEKAPAEGFEDVPVVGKAQTLEAMGKYDEALAIFEKFAAEKPNNYLTLTAQLGAARCVAEKGDKDAALKQIETLKAATTDALSKTRIEVTEDCIKRYVKK